MGVDPAGCHRSAYHPEARWRYHLPLFEGRRVSSTEERSWHPRDERPAHRRNGESRRKTWIYPSEFLQLVACGDVREWRLLCVPSSGELFALRWEDVDLDAEAVAVLRA
jgi:hypothetical protein